MKFEEIVEKAAELLLEVSFIKKRLVRKGKVVKKKKCPKGYRLIGNRCVRQAARERIRRKRAGRKAARKSKAARKRNMKRSLRIRSRRKLKRYSFKRR